MDGLIRSNSGPALSLLATVQRVIDGDTIVLAWMILDF
jgi:hypothetical protein